MALTVAQIVQLYRTEGAARYGMEAVSQEQHALQCAQLAEQAGAGVALVAAALLHDLGHLLALPESATGKDDLHEYRALPFLRGEYPEAVLQPVRLHVAAKRYLCATQADYWDSLSQASKHSLELQGGPFSVDEVEQFLLEPHALDAVSLRMWDDLAKDPLRVTPGWEHYRRVLERVCLHQPEKLAA
ncbi:HD domain-containing protein [Ramlibacter sp. G-1-2-2]|uniref:HD domain-containing protein n=1 Tax=Ramlibacter agri TaxID=2728837 RepID=A0A848GVF1_9BURK|nr:phosphonate degradation HD-domain oxygenase [Ramlibacter agri]NML42616.1 HD domain-containing protein [Ramlibacter agri]